MNDKSLSQSLTITLPMRDPTSTYKTADIKICPHEYGIAIGFSDDPTSIMGLYVEVWEGNLQVHSYDASSLEHGEPVGKLVVGYIPDLIAAAKEAHETPDLS